MAKPHRGVAQMSTLAKWGLICNKGVHFDSPPTGRVAGSFGPCYLHTAPAPIEEMQPSPFREGQGPIPSDEWYADGSSRVQPAVWTAVAIQPETDMIWFDTGGGQSSKWAEL